jgi:hypothetical protein
VSPPAIDVWNRGQFSWPHLHIRSSFQLFTSVRWLWFVCLPMTFRTVYKFISQYITFLHFSLTFCYERRGKRAQQAWAKQDSYVLYQVGTWRACYELNWDKFWGWNCLFFVTANLSVLPCALKNTQLVKTFWHVEFRARNIQARRLMTPECLNFSGSAVSCLGV